MQNSELAGEWLNRAYSNLERARAGKQSESVYFEDLCYDCQQSVEKALKALLVFNNLQYPYTHTISKLLELIQEHKARIPADILESVILSDYAVETRYPGDYEPVQEDEYLKALQIAESVYKWVTNLVQ